MMVLCRFDVLSVLFLLCCQLCANVQIVFMKHKLDFNGMKNILSGAGPKVCFANNIPKI